MGPLLLLIACPAEQLGIELPPGGADAISHEDLRRDVRLLTEGEPAGVFAARLGQMQMEPGPVPSGVPAASTCLVRGADERPLPRVLVAPWPEDADTATAAAALISLAKAWDLGGGPPERTTLCVLPAGSAAPAPVGRLVWVGPLAAGEVRIESGRFFADLADPSRTADRIVYTEVQARVKQLFATL